MEENRLEETKLRIANNLKKFRTLRKVTQKQLAEHLGVNDSTVSSWEKGINSIDIAVLFEICDFLGVPISEFSEPIENEKSPDMDLSEDEIKLITYFRKLSHDNQMKVMGFIEIMAPEK